MPLKLKCPSRLRQQTNRLNKYMTEINVEHEIQNRFKSLPLVVQRSIKSASVEKHLRDLANVHKLHVDQWELLENEVMMTLLGFSPPDQLETHLRDSLKIAPDTAHLLAVDINTAVFEPIRNELERELEHPEAPKAARTEVENARESILSDAERKSDSQTPEERVLPQATMEPQRQEKPKTEAPKSIRAPISETYKPAEPSRERAAIDGDPYREQIE